MSKITPDTDLLFQVPSSLYSSLTFTSNTVGPLYVLPFGRHKGKTVQYIYENEQSYIEWMFGQVDKTNFSKVLESIEIIRKIEYEYFKSIFPKPTDKDVQINFGKYNGSKLSDIIKNDKGYAIYLRNRVPPSRTLFKFYYKIETIVDSVINCSDIEIQPEEELIGTCSISEEESLNSSFISTSCVDKSMLVKFIKTQDKTLLLYNEGKTIDEIAAERNLVRSTVEDHIIYLIKLKKITNFDMNTPIINSIRDFIEEYIHERGVLPALKDVKDYFELIGETVSYFEIKLAMINFA